MDTILVVAFPLIPLDSSSPDSLSSFDMSRLQVRWGEGAWGRDRKLKHKSMWEERPVRKVGERETYEVLNFVLTQLPTELYDELIAGIGVRG
jgi:hypothetical protein